MSTRATMPDRSGVKPQVRGLIDFLVDLGRRTRLWTFFPPRKIKITESERIGMDTVRSGVTKAEDRSGAMLPGADRWADGYERGRAAGRRELADEVVALIGDRLHLGPVSLGDLVALLDRRRAPPVRA